MTYDTSKEKMVKVNGVELATETFGDASNPALLLIQGAGNSMISWGDEFCQKLADGGRFVIRFDNRDAGRSTSYETGKPGYNLRDLEADALGVLDAFGIEKAHVLGMSQGAAIAQLLAIDHPERLKTITLVSGTPGGPGHNAADLPGMTDEITKIFNGEAGPAEPDWNDRDSVANYLTEGERPFAGGATFDENWFRTVSGKIFDRSLNLASQLTNPFMLDAGEPWREKLSSITTPTLVIHGAHDPAFPIEHGEALAKEIPGATLVRIEDMGHAHIVPALWPELAKAILEHTS